MHKEPFYLVKSSADHPDLHSFPTRRSSDLQRSTSTTPSSSPSWTPAKGRSAGSPDRCGQRTALSRVSTRARDRKSTRLNSSHLGISYAVFCLKKKNKKKKEIIY